MYSKIDEHMKNDMVIEFKVIKSNLTNNPYYATNTLYAVACTARKFITTDRQWNGPKGTDMFAATLATLVMKGQIELK